MTHPNWRCFVRDEWCGSINVRDFVMRNYNPYEGDESFLSPATERTQALWEQTKALLNQEREAGGVLDIDTGTISGVDAYPPGYIDKELELIVGLQTDAPLKRAIMPNGGLRMVKTSLDAYGREMPAHVKEVYRHRKTHNDGVFDGYTGEMRAVRRSGVITGLPDAYGRGRIIGDYRRTALYGVDFLIEQKKIARENCFSGAFDEVLIRAREELSEQIRALESLKRMAASYGCDISQPAGNLREAIQWVYFAYLAAVKDQNGAAMSLGRVSTFLDIYAQRDFDEGTLDEAGAQELFDQFVDRKSTRLNSSH